MTGGRPAAGLPLAAALDNTAAGGASHCLSVFATKYLLTVVILG